MSRNVEYQYLLGALKERGYRLTGPRRALLKLLTSATAPLSIQEMHAAVNGRTDREEGEEEVNLVTVYRFANLLVDLRLARRVEFGQGYYRYEREEPQDGPHHHHLICQICGRVEDFLGCLVPEMVRRLEEERGFRVERHELELYGTCTACQQTPV